jgi:GLPGLI family protein
MKKFILIYFLILFFTANSQTGIITYGLKGIKDDSLSEMTKKINAEFELMAYTLKYNDSVSYFYQEQNIPKELLYSKLATVNAGSISDFFQYLKTKQSLRNNDVVNTTYRLDYSIRMNNWELVNETKKIDNYTCYKAIHKRFVQNSQTYRVSVAWYTPEIPVPYGPAGFGGLPGLILELRYSNNVVYVVNNILLNSKLKPLSKIEAGELITPREWAILSKKNRKVTPD